ncbi:MAG: TPM domain-containing protein [Rhodocyclales bacterium]|nr:TPM domain-containing protein [Rhodocyclales bacterium]
MNVLRMLKHVFAAADLAAIGQAITASEIRHRGELRFVVEAGLPPAALWRDTSPRQRAAELFAVERVWDTEENSGILIYVLLADRRVEILADRGITARVPQAEWDAICRGMEQGFRAGGWREGALAAVNRASELLAEHFPAAGRNPNELPDAPLML